MSRLPARTVTYNRDIRPIFADMCFACHGADEETREADLRLDVAASALEMSAIVPGDVGASEIIARIMSDDPDLVMPPPETKKSVTDEQKETLAAWIRQGAEYQRHWSLESPQIVDIEHADTNWRKNKIDDYVAAGLAELNLTAAQEAEPAVLFRRLHLDITGLPPSPEDQTAFLSGYASAKTTQMRDEAYSSWIDRLMERPAWGEHRARYWLDAARYGDTHGLHMDNYREMWPYRDWVIRAFNANQRFDQFIVEQLAGDLLEEPTESQLIATGFQRCNITTSEGGTIDEENLAIYAADRVQTFGWVFLGLTTNCAQCHDHKFDPITMKDYYSLAAFFRNTTERAKDGNRKQGAGAVLILPSESDRPRWDALPDEIAAAKQARDAYRETIPAKANEWLASASSDELRKSVSNEGLALHAPLDEGSGNDLSVRGDLNATIHNPVDVAWETFGDRPAAPLIQNDTPIGLGPYGKVDTSDAFSITAWIRTPASGNAAIVAKMDTPNAFRGWDFFQEGNLLAVHLIDNWPNNAIKVKTTAPVLEPNEWQHVAMTYDGSGKFEGVKIYVDGVVRPTRAERNTIQPNASFLTDVPLQVGARKASPTLNGLSVSDLRLYRRTLSGNEVSNNSQVDAVARLIARRKATLADDDSQNDFMIDGQDRKLVEAYFMSIVDKGLKPLDKKIAELEGEKRTIQSRSPITHIQEEKPSPAMAHMLIRGQYDQKGEQVSANTPAALHPMHADTPKNRLGLANWVVDPANPLTARVSVNRFWQEVFGQGLVPTVEDFGVTGMLPSNPELLDYLAVDFSGNGWDVKRFFKRIFESATYRQAAITTPQKELLDRDNAMLSRGPRFRMDAEMIRDCALASSGLLSRKMYGPGARPYQPTDIWNVVGLRQGDTRNYTQDTGENLYRRTVYSFWKRMAPPPNMEALNAPSREVCVVRRERTNTPLQALVTLNDPQFVEAARYLATEAIKQGGSDQNAVLQFIAARVLCRPLAQEEVRILSESLDEFLAHYQQNAEDAVKLLAVGETQPPSDVPATTLAAWTLVCNQVMNLDEVVCK